MTFNEYMNRPLKRVQVFTWRMACDLFDSIPLQTFRSLPPFRSEASKVARREIAHIVRIKRSLGYVRLPKYNERQAEYIF